MRYLTSFIEQDLEKKMVFLAGPRQVGKTTLSKNILKKNHSQYYYSWDDPKDKKKLLQAQWPLEKSLVVLDELHKYRNWKSWIKGQYDKHHEKLKFLITGSARMDIYRKGGDSLQGRYHHYRLHPFSLAEVLKIKNHFSPFQKLNFHPSKSTQLLNNLLHYSGFPEPFFAQDEREHRRWQKERLERFFREDVRDLENVRDLSHLQLATELIPERVASLFSLNSLREDLEVSHRALTHWMDILERLYFLFRIYPFNNKLSRSLKSQPKVYLWDWSLVMSEGARLENLVASHLLKFCHFLEDVEGYKTELCYWRDLDKREVDFIVSLNKKAWFAVEVKNSEEKISKNLSYLGERLKIPFLFQIHYNSNEEYQKENIQVLPVEKFLTALV